MWERYTRISLIQRISVGIIIGAILGVIVPTWTGIGILGDVFVNSLKAVAPLLVFFLIMSSLSRHEEGTKTHMRTIVSLYIAATLAAAFVAIAASYLFPVEIVLPKSAASGVPAAPKGFSAVITQIINSAIDNPIKSLVEGNYLSLLVWASLIGLALRPLNKATKQAVSDFAAAITSVIQFIIQLAPFGIIGLVFRSVSETGLSGLARYGQLILLIAGSMIFVSLVVYPAMVWFMTRQNPYPLTFYALCESGVSAFFTRSSAVNIPINMELSRRLGLNEKKLTRFQSRWVLPLTPVVQL